MKLYRFLSKHDHKYRLTILTLHGIIGATTLLLILKRFYA